MHSAGSFLLDWRRTLFMGMDLLQPQIPAFRLIRPVGS
jgi:hypothetical protein